MQVDAFGAAKKIQIIYLTNKLFVQQCMLYTRFSILICAFHSTTNCLSVRFSSSFLYSTLCLRFRLLRLSLSCPLSPLDTVLTFRQVQDRRLTPHLQFEFSFLCTLPAFAHLCTAFCSPSDCRLPKPTSAGSPLCLCSLFTHALRLAGTN
jgi:hypothetical protein